MSANPFSDSYAASDYDSFDYAEHVGKDGGMTIAFSEEVTVTYLNCPSPLRIPSSAFSDTSDSMTSSSSSQSPFKGGKIEWTNADLYMLVSAFCPNPMLTSELFFIPSLDTLDKVTYPLRLELYLRIPPAPVPRSSYSAAAPIGTGRPTTKRRIAASALCSSAVLVRRSFAATFLGDGANLRYMAAYYELMATLFLLSVPALYSVLRGLRAMGNATEAEWNERLAQMVGAQVDVSWGFEANLEAFLLRVGFWELERWEIAAETALRLGESDREEYARVLGETGVFLERVMEQL